MRLTVLFAVLLVIASCKAVSIGKKESEPDPVLLTQANSPVIIIDASVSNFSGTHNGKLTEQAKREYCQRVKSELKSRLSRTVIIDTVTIDSIKQLMAGGDTKALLAVQKQYNADVVFVLKDCTGDIIANSKLTKLLSSSDDNKPVTYSVFFNSNWIIYEKDRNWSRTINVQEERTEKTKKGSWLGTTPDYDSKANDMRILGAQNATKLALLMKY